MVSSTAANSTALWPPDDSEESIVGVSRHQLDIISLRTGINEEAHRVAGSGVLPWQATSQVMLLGLRRPDHSRYTVLPDVFVYLRVMDRTRGSYALEQEGPPVLVVEVASESTYRADLDLDRGKAWSYADAGVAEYLVLDPTGEFVPAGGRGWRLENGVYQPWTPDRQGRWHSEQIAVAMGSEEGLAVVYGADERRRLREGEVEATLQAERAEGRAQGRVEGHVEGEFRGRMETKRADVRRIVQLRFGNVPAPLEERIAAADPATLDALFDRAIAVSTLDAL